MAGSNEHLHPWPGQSLMFEDYTSMPASDPQLEICTENNNFESREDPILGPVAIEACVLDLEQRSGDASGSQTRPVALSSQYSTQGRSKTIDDYGVEEQVMPKHDRGHGKRPLTDTSGEPNRSTRFRGDNWDIEQKTELLFGVIEDILTSTLRSLGVGQNTDAEPRKSWFHQVAKKLHKEPTQCQGQWDSLQKSYRAIDDHEKKIKEGKSSHPSFWDMTSDVPKRIVNQERRNAKLPELPRHFERKWSEMLEFISQIRYGSKKIPLWKKAFNKFSSKEVATDLPMSYSNPTTSKLMDQTVISQGISRGPLDATGSQPSSSYHQDSTIPPEPMINITFQGNQEVDDQFSKLVKRHVEDALKTMNFPQRTDDERNDREMMVACRENSLAQQALENEHLRGIFLSRQIGNANFCKAQSRVALDMGENLAHAQLNTTNCEMTTSGMSIHPLPNANAAMWNINYLGTQTEVDVGSNFQTVNPFYLGNVQPSLGGMIHQPPNVNVDAVQNMQILPNPDYVIQGVGSNFKTINPFYLGSVHPPSGTGLIHEPLNVNVDAIQNLQILTNAEYGSQIGMGLGSNFQSVNPFYPGNVHLPLGGLIHQPPYVNGDATQNLQILSNPDYVIQGVSSNFQTVSPFYPGNVHPPSGIGLIHQLPNVNADAIQNLQILPNPDNGAQTGIGLGPNFQSVNPFYPRNVHPPSGTGLIHQLPNVNADAIQNLQILPNPDYGAQARSMNDNMPNI